MSRLAASLPVILCRPCGQCASICPFQGFGLNEAAVFNSARVGHFHRVVHAVPRRNAPRPRVSRARLCLAARA